MDTSTPGESHRMETVVPAPVEIDPTGDEFDLAESTVVRYGSSDDEPVADYLAEVLRSATGYPLPVEQGETESSADAIVLSSVDPPADVPAEGYVLEVTADGVTIAADGSPGLVAGVATLRQLLPPTIESPRKQPGPWPVHGGTVRDFPRFEYRGAQLDVARHFFTVDEVKRFVDLIAAYKINHLHLHLTDDQGWRIEIDAWPRLTSHGARTDIDGGEGGYYTKDDYRELVEYAGVRGITVVPEIDMPAHAGAAVASYPELAYGEPKPDPESDGGTLAVDEEETYRFVEDVLEEVAELTPGPYLHFGGDEADDLSDAEYARFVERVLPAIEELGKRPVGWQEVVTADPPDSTVVQYWKDTEPDLAGHDVVFSPNTHAYLNFRYDEETPPDGPETWGRRITSVPTSYAWDPGAYYDAVPESSVLGTEFALWSEELRTFEDVTYMALPRMAGIAELGWSPADETGWERFAPRLAAQAPRWAAMGIEYYRSPVLTWPC